MTKQDGRRWATIEQIQWILSWLPEYLEAQRTNTFHTFWPKLFAAWFKAFPNRKPTDADMTDSEEEPDSGPDAPAESADEHNIEAEKRKQKKRQQRKKTHEKKVHIQCQYYLLPTHCLSTESCNEPALASGQEGRPPCSKETGGIYIFDFV